MMVHFVKKEQWINVYLIVKQGNATAIKDAFESGILDIDVENGTKYLSYNSDVKNYISENINQASPQDEATLRSALSDEITKIETTCF